jgi:hypothetical protein
MPVKFSRTPANRLSIPRITRRRLNREPLPACGERQVRNLRHGWRLLRRL